MNESYKIPVVTNILGEFLFRAGNTALTGGEQEEGSEEEDR
jgi:hypothetical protein